MQNHTPKFTNLKTGLTVFFGIIIFFLFFMIIGTRGTYFDDTYRLKTVVGNVDGLAEGAKVTLGGLKIGRVDKLRFYFEENRNAIEIEMRIRREFQPRITQQSRAYIKTVGMLGDKFIDISMGTPGSSVLEQDSYVIPGEQLSLDNLSAKIGPVLDDLNQTMSNLKTASEGLANNGSVIGRLLGDENLGGQLASTVTNLEKFSDQLNDDNTSIGKLASGTELYDRLNQAAANLQQISSRIRKGQGSAGKLVMEDSLYQSARNIAGRLERLLAQSESNQTLAGALLTDRNLMRRVDTVIVKLDSLVSDIRRNPKRYMDISIF